LSEREHISTLHLGRTAIVKPCCIIHEIQNNIVCASLRVVKRNIQCGPYFANASVLTSDTF